MSPTHLVACPSCARHLRVSEPLCPFCGNALDPDVQARPAPSPPAMRLSRAALFALGTGAATLSTAACSSSSTTGSEHGDAAQSSGFSATPMYGGTGMMITGRTTGTSESSTNYAVPYGVPASTGSEVSSTSSSGVSFTAQPAYGAPASSHEASTSSSGSMATAQPAYGAPASSGHESSAKTPDGGTPDGSLAGAYGGPPQDDFCDTGCGGLTGDALA